MVFIPDLTMFHFYNGEFKFTCLIQTTHFNRTLIVGDSLLRNFYMYQVDRISIPGARSDDLEAFVHGYRFATFIRHYSKIILFLGGNSVNDFPKNNVMRQAETPGEVLFIWNNIVQRIKILNPACNVAIVCVPIRTNGTADRLKELNYIIGQVPEDCRYCGIGTKMFAVTVVNDDEVHLSEIGISYLKSIIKNKVLPW